MSTETTIRKGYKDYKKNYSQIFWIAFVAIPIGAVVGAIQLNIHGHRFWDMIIGLVLGLVALSLAFKPVVMEALFFLGIGDKLLDGKPNSWKEVLTGGWQLAKDLYGPLIYVLLVVQTVFTAMSIRRFESASSAYVAVLALAIFAAVFYLVVAKGKWLSTFMLVFWAGLALYSMGMAWFVPGYFQDDADYEMRHIQTERATAERENRLDVLLNAMRTRDLTLSEQKEKEYLLAQSKKVNQTFATEEHFSMRLQDGLGGVQGTLIQILAKPADYTCHAVITSNDPMDEEVLPSTNLDGLATAVYINGQPCNGQEPVTIGPDGKARLHFNLDPEALVTIRGGAKRMEVTFTPAS
jgi:hypothetical protein